MRESHSCKRSGGVLASFLIHIKFDEFFPRPSKAGRGEKEIQAHADSITRRDSDGRLHVRHCQTMSKGEREKTEGLPSPSGCDGNLVP